jgi:uncharacterized membrane protein
MTSTKPRLSHLHPATRFMRLHARLLTAAGVGVLSALVLPSHWPLPTRVLLGWDIGVGLYLLITAAMLIRSDLDRLRRRAAEVDEGAWVITFLAALAGLASLGAIFAELGAAKGKPDAWALHIALAVVTIALSWFFTHMIFAQHYAHAFYGEKGERGECLNFPGKDDPDYWDFLYFSLVIGMTSQVSDVAVTSSQQRRIVAAHGVLSFVFNTTIIALTVNIASSVL